MVIASDKYNKTTKVLSFFKILKEGEESNYISIKKKFMHYLVYKLSKY